MGEVDVYDLDKGQAIILERIANMREDVALKHKQNRTDIHALKNMIQETINDLWKLKIKIAGYSAVSGVITTLVIHIVETLLKK